MILSEKWYNRARWFVLTVLPAFSAAYFALSDLFNLANALQVTGVCAILATFLGQVLRISTNNYVNSDARFDGDMIITESEDGASIKLDLNTEPEILAGQDSVTFRKITQTT